MLLQSENSSLKGVADVEGGGGGGGSKTAPVELPPPPAPAPTASPQVKKSIGKAVSGGKAKPLPPRAVSVPLVYSNEEGAGPAAAAAAAAADGEGDEGIAFFVDGRCVVVNDDHAGSNNNNYNYNIFLS